MTSPERKERQARIRTERLAELGALLAGFAHEVRNPLSTIGLNLQLVLEEFRNADTPRDKRTQKRLVLVEQEVRRLQKILDEFLSYARAPEPKLVACDLNARIQALVDFSTPEMREQGIGLRFFPNSAVGTILADWDHLQAAMVNLLRNARESIQGPGEVMVSTVREGDAVLVRVTDTGAGIQPEHQARVLDPYFSTKKTGTGLGLPTVRRIVEEHDGTLTFTSEPGKGTQFTIRLPAPTGRAAGDKA